MFNEDLIDENEEIETKTKGKETKSEKFLRVAEARTNKIVGMVRLLGQCSNTLTYEYTKKEVESMFNYIEEELIAAKAKYTFEEDNKKQFKFK